METTQNLLRTVGTRGVGEWATWTLNDNQHKVTVFDGWLISNEMTFTGTQAEQWAEMVTTQLAEDIEAGY